MFAFSIEISDFCVCVCVGWHGEVPAPGRQPSSATLEAAASAHPDVLAWVVLAGACL